MENFKIHAKQRNEGLYLLDWLSWHMAIGFNHFHITSNDCNDSSDILLNAVSEETNLLTQYYLKKKNYTLVALGSGLLIR